MDRVGSESLGRCEIDKFVNFYDLYRILSFLYRPR